MELQEENKMLQEKLFRFKNLTEYQLKSYTGLELSVFQTIIEMIKRFFP